MQRILLPVETNFLYLSLTLQMASLFFLFRKISLLHACNFQGEMYKDQEPSASNLFECLYRKKRNDTPYVQIAIAC